MEAQLHLLPDEPAAQAADRDWRLDEPTRALGRRGVADARRALRAARRHVDHLDEHHDDERPSAA